MTEQENISDILSLTKKQALHWPTEASVPAVVRSAFYPVSSNTNIQKSQ